MLWQWFISCESTPTSPPPTPKHNIDENITERALSYHSNSMQGWFDDADVTMDCLGIKTHSVCDHKGSEGSHRDSLNRVEVVSCKLSGREPATWATWLELRKEQASLLGVQHVTVSGWVSWKIVVPKFAGWRGRAFSPSEAYANLLWFRPTHSVGPCCLWWGGWRQLFVAVLTLPPAIHQTHGCPSSAGLTATAWQKSLSYLSQAWPWTSWARRAAIIM